MQRSKKRNLLLVSSQKLAIFLENLAAKSSPTNLQLTKAEKIGDGLEMLGRNNFDAIVLELASRESQGLEKLERLWEWEIFQQGNLASEQADSSGSLPPVVVVVRRDDEDLGISAVAAGAEDYLIAEDINSADLEKTLLLAQTRASRDKAIPCAYELEKTSSLLEAEIAKRQKLENILTLHEHYLETIAAVQQRLLADDIQPWDYQGILALLGEASGASRVHIWEGVCPSHPSSNTHPTALVVRCQWTAFGIAPRGEISTTTPADWQELIAGRQVINGVAADFPDPELEWLIDSGTLSVLMLPLMVNGSFIGAIGFDNCYEQTSYQPPEVALLQSGAAAISLHWHRQKSEAAMRESEARFRLMADRAPVLIWVADAEGRCQFFNQTWLEFTGRSLEEEMGDGWLCGVHPEDRQRCMYDYLTAFEARATFEIEYRLRRSDGQYRWILDRGIPRFSPNGEFAGYIGSCVDISGLKHAEVELAQKNAELQAILQGIPDLFFRLAADGTILDYKGGSKSDLYVPPTVFLGRPIQEVLPPDVSQKIAATITVVDQSQLIANIEYELTQFGKEQHYEARLVPFGQGQVVAIVRNISEKVQFETALKESQEQLHNILDCLEDVVWSVEAKTQKALFVNPAFRQLYGFSADDFLANSLLWLEAVHPEDRPLVEQESEVLWQVGSKDIEYRIIRPDGQVRWVRDRARLIYDPKGNPLRIDGIATDITDRKEFERALEQERSQLRQVVTHTPVAMAMFDRQMCYLAYSRQWLSDYNLPPESLMGRSHYEAFPDLPDRWKLVHERALQGESINQPEDRFDRADGSIIYCRWAIHPWYAPDGSVGGTVIATHNINELVQARESALEAARIKSQFLANMSHEIRTPMNGILGMTEILLKTELNQEQIDFLQTLKTSGYNLLTIINDILDFSKLEAGEMRLDFANFDLKKTLAYILDLFAPNSRAKGLNISCVVEPEVPYLLTGDASRLSQILANLISNAIKFTDAGDILIHVDIAPGKNPGSSAALGETIKLRFRVKDGGIGITPEGQKQLFKSFSQVDSSITRKYGGTGLGLAICKQLVELMGGEIGLESQTGQGSTFWFTATFTIGDVAIADVDSLAQLLSAEELGQKPNYFPWGDGDVGSLAQLQAFSTIKILVVEDTRINQKVIIQQLKQLGLEADVVHNGKEALDRLEQENYHIVFMDCQMPVLDGYEATRLLRAKPSATRPVVIGLTAYALPGDRERCLEAGMDDYLSKPVSGEDIHLILLHWSPLYREQNQAAIMRRSQLPESSPFLGTSKDDIDNPLASVVNLQRLQHISQGNFTLQMELMRSFVEEAVNSLSEAKTALTDGNFQTIADGAHKIKGSGSNLGVLLLPELAAQLEIASRQNNLETATELIASLEQVLSQLQSVVLTDDLLLPEANTNRQDLPINWQYLHKISNGNAEFEQKLLLTFVEAAENYLAHCQIALSNNDTQTLHYHIHQLKGSAATAGVHLITELATQIEDYAKKNDLEECDILLLELEAILYRLRAYIRSL